MINKPIIIAIDGPAASGKGTVARKVARHFGLRYLDTGSIYRAVGYKILKDGLDPEDEGVAVAVATGIRPEDIENAHLYDEGVGRAASIVSAMPGVREVLFGFQREFASNPAGAVLDGRDIGTVVCPDADYKFYITANMQTRAERRFKQLQNKGESVIYDSVLRDLQSRDERDSKRAIAPLKKADDAIAIDTTDMGEDEVFTKIVGIVCGNGCG